MGRENKHRKGKDNEHEEHLGVIKSVDFLNTLYQRKPNLMSLEC